MSLERSSDFTGMGLVDWSVAGYGHGVAPASDE